MGWKFDMSIQLSKEDMIDYVNAFLSTKTKKGDDSSVIDSLAAYAEKKNLDLFSMFNTDEGLTPDQLKALGTDWETAKQYLTKNHPGFDLVKVFTYLPKAVLLDMYPSGIMAYDVGLFFGMIENTKAEPVGTTFDPKTKEEVNVYPILFVSGGNAPISTAAIMKEITEGVYKEKLDIIKARAKALASNFDEVRNLLKSENASANKKEVDKVIVTDVKVKGIRVEESPECDVRLVIDSVHTMMLRPETIREMKGDKGGGNKAATPAPVKAPPRPAQTPAKSPIPSAIPNKAPSATSVNPNGAVQQKASSSPFSIKRS